MFYYFLKSCRWFTVHQIEALFGINLKTIISVLFVSIFAFVSRWIKSYSLIERRCFHINFVDFYVKSIWSRLSKSEIPDSGWPRIISKVFLKDYLISKFLTTFNYVNQIDPGLTKTSYHTIFIYEKLLVIQFHTIPYVQKIVWKLYDKHFSIYENCMISVFP